MAKEKFFIVTLPVGELSASDVAQCAVKELRVVRPGLTSEQVRSFPLTGGGSGSLEHLVTSRLGSFLEVEAHSADGEEKVIPLGFIGDNGQTAVIDAGMIAGSNESVPIGTSAGIGELIVDALDESAFSIVLCGDGPLASDFGFGMAQALGVKFFIADKLVDVLTHPELAADVDRIDASGRSFALLSSRVFVSDSICKPGAVPPDKNVLTKLAKIVKRDCGVEVAISLVEKHGANILFGILAFLPAEIMEGELMMLELAGWNEELETASVHVIVIGDSLSDIENSSNPGLKKIMEDIVKWKCRSNAFILNSEEGSGKPVSNAFERIQNLNSPQLFLPPLPSNASVSDRRRDLAVRMALSFPNVFEPQAASQPI